MGNPIAFPGLGIGPFDPPNIAIQFPWFNYQIHWYGVIIAVGFLLAFIYGMKRCEQFGFNQDQLLDVLFVATPVAIICARAYYVVFNFDLYRDNPTDIFKIWYGGLAIYGGVIGGLVAASVAAKIKKIKPGALLDLSVLGFMIGQAVGRWGNFINREAYGTATNLPWRMEITDVFTGMRSAVHPCFLYESLWNALGVLILHFVSKKRKYDGQIFLLYLAWYGLGRGIIEGLRTDSLFVPGTMLRISQLFGFASFLIALLILLYNALFRRFDPENMQVFRYRKTLAAAAAVPSAAMPESANAVELNPAQTAEPQLPSEPEPEPELKKTPQPPPEQNSDQTSQ